MKGWLRNLSRRLGRQPLIFALLALGLLTGCATQNPYTTMGAGLGTAVGAGVGIAASRNNPLAGALIGGLLGGTAGAVAGSVYGRPNTPPPQQGYYQQPQPYYGPPPGAYRGPAPGYGYSAPPYANNYALNTPIPEPPTNARTPIKPAPYITEEKPM